MVGMSAPGLPACCRIACALTCPSGLERCMQLDTEDLRKRSKGLSGLAGVLQAAASSLTFPYARADQVCVCVRLCTCVCLRLCLCMPACACACVSNFVSTIARVGVFVTCLCTCMRADAGLCARVCARTAACSHVAGLPESGSMLHYVGSQMRASGCLFACDTWQGRMLVSWIPI